MYWADSGDGSSTGQGSIMIDRRGQKCPMSGHYLLHTEALPRLTDRNHLPCPGCGQPVEVYPPRDEWDASLYLIRKHTA